MTDSSTTEALIELARRAELTCKARYHAARRLNTHNWFSQWTLALLAVGQTALSVAQAIPLQLRISEVWFNFGSIFFSVLILAYSLMLGMSNFSARAVRIHECGLALGRLVRNLYQIQRGAPVQQSEYQEFSKLYYDILEKYENHTRTDYLVAHYEYYESKSETANSLSSVKFKFRLFHALQFSHYVITLLLMAAFAFLVLAGAG
jgi:hypothetical protein